MNQGEKISIIIPVYNSGQYLRRCLKSVISQTYRNIDIILVDDGSSDNSSKICDEFLDYDNRIRVFHKKNSGPADTRNYGTKRAFGDFITYVDSDDWIENNMIEKLYYVIKEVNAQISICATKKVNFETKIKQSKSKIIELSGLDSLELMLYQKKFDTSVYAKLYKTDLMRKYPFPTGKLYEDLFIMYKVLFDATKVVYLPEKLYYYFNNQNGIMHRNFSNDVFDEIEAADEIVDFISKNCPEILPAALSRKFSAYCQVFRWIPKNELNKSILSEKEKIWDFIIKYRWKMMTDSNARFKNKAAAFLTLFGKI